MKTKKTRKEKGITLIALVITIVILIILATITVNFIFGENGLINRAQQGSEEYSKAEAKEKVELLLSEYVIDKATGENDNFANFLRKNLQVGVAENDDNTYSFMLGEWQVVTRENKVISIEKFKLDVDKTYPSVASMKADTELTEGQLVQTEGYWDKQYAGGAYYDIVSSTSLTVDNGKCIQLDNGLYAELHPINDTVTVNQFGAYGDGEHDDASAIQLALNAGYGNVSFESERYKFGATITLSTSKVSIIGNSATLFWDEETPIVFSQVYICGNYSNHVTNIGLYYLNFENNNINMGYYPESVQLQADYCENIIIEYCNFNINEIVDNTSRNITNIWFTKEWNNIKISNSNFVNLTHGSKGGNIWLSDSTETVNYVSGNAEILNNNFEKSCHDESIAIWQGIIKNITISSNSFKLYEDKVENPTTMCFTLGNEGIVENIYFTNNKIDSESKGNFINCYGDEGSKNIYINDNNIKWTLLLDNNSYEGIISNKNTENVIVSKNNIEYNTTGKGYLYNFVAPTSNIEYSYNDIMINGNLTALSGAIGSKYNHTKLINNNITINGNLSYLYEGYEFSGNTVNINGLFGTLGDGLSNILFGCSGGTLYGDVNINNNIININNQGETSLSAFFLAVSSKLNGYSIYLNNNNINYNTAESKVFIQTQEIHDTDIQKIYANNNVITGFKKIVFYQNEVNPILYINSLEVTNNTTL